MAGGQNFANKLNQQGEIMRRLYRHMQNIEQRLGFLETKIDAHIKATKDGNWTRNSIALMVAAKILFEGFGSIDWSGVSQLIKMFGG